RKSNLPPRHALRARVISVRIEQLLAVDFVIGDCLLSLRRNRPVDEGLAKLLFDVWVLCGIHQDDAVLVEKPFVALDRDSEIAAVLERQPGAAIRQHVGVRGRRSVECRAHALADLSVYQGPFSFSISMPAAFQRLSSAMCVPERSPRVRPFASV